MKIKKIMPVFAAALLLAGCSGNSGVTTMKKPSFAKYSNAVSYEDFVKAAQEQFKEFYKIVETEGEGDAIIVKGLKNGYTATTKTFESQEFTGKNNSGVSMSYSLKDYQEVTDKIDKKNQRVNEAVKEEVGIEMKNGYAYESYSLVEKDGQKAIINSEPYYINMKGSSANKVEEQIQNEFSEGKVKEIDVYAKEFETTDLASYDFSKTMAQTLVYGMQSAVSAVMYSVPSYVEEANIKYYADGKVLTVTGEQTFEGTIKYSEENEYTSKTVISYVGQVNFDKLTAATSTELTLDQTSKNGTLKYVDKAYRASSITNKDVTLKAIDTAKFVDLDA